MKILRSLECFVSSAVKRKKMRVELEQAKMIKESNDLYYILSQSLQKDIIIEECKVWHRDSTMFEVILPNNRQT